MLAGTISLFAAADFVSMVDHKSAGGIIVEGTTNEDIKKVILETMPIGTVTLRMDDINPSTIYGGTWSLITGDASLSLGDGTVKDGIITGNNNPSVPLVAHNHGRGIQEITGTQLGRRIVNINGSGAFFPTNAGYEDWVVTSSTKSSNSLGFQASRAWTGRSTTEGVQNATIDVRGAQMKVNVWKRTE
jgi:hypothetical protein